jgi:hypothetical protein
MKSSLDGTSIHELAKTMLADGFVGQGMRDEKKAEDYILMAADNPNVEHELPPTGFKFWQAANFFFKVFKARRNFGKL